jgi:Uma2 family endonuclease
VEDEVGRGKAAGVSSKHPSSAGDELLIVEVLSPHDSAAGLVQKLREYFAIGVRLVWVADPAARAVLAYRSLTDVRELTSWG